MQKDEAYFQQLFQLYLENKCSPSQLRELFSYLGKSDADRMIIEQLQNEFSSSFSAGNNPKDRVPAKGAIIIPLYKKRWLKYAVATAVIIILSISCYLTFFLSSAKKNIAQHPANTNNTILPGGDKATLTLADGRTIFLDSTSIGTIARQGNTKIVKNSNGQIVYTPQTSGVNEVYFNTISTPSGGQFHIVLPDGSDVWLNASSSIKFPSGFTGNERKVEISGEAYFEIVKNVSMPFKVRVDGNEEIEVLGTHFNVMAYNNEEASKTTLLEGSIKITNNSITNFLKPGQQAISGKAGKINIVSDVNTSHVIAWKNGLFDFDNDMLPEIMRQIARWYNAEVVYQGTVPSGHYAGSIKRESNITQVLDMLEFAGNVKFSIDGTKIIVKEK